MKKHFLVLAMAALVLYLHVIGMEHALYFYHWWYDIVLHTLGGATLALFISLFTKKWSHIVFGVVLIATAWELFEYVVHIETLTGSKYIIDTTIDYIMALIGTSLVIWRS